MCIPKTGIFMALKFVFTCDKVGATYRDGNNLQPLQKGVRNECNDYQEPNYGERCIDQLPTQK